MQCHSKKIVMHSNKLILVILAWRNRISFENLNWSQCCSITWMNSLNLMKRLVKLKWSSRKEKEIKSGLWKEIQLKRRFFGGAMIKSTWLEIGRMTDRLKDEFSIRENQPVNRSSLTSRQLTLQTVPIGSWTIGNTHTSHYVYFQWCPWQLPHDSQ